MCHRGRAASPENLIVDFSHFREPFVRRQKARRTSFWPSIVRRRASSLSCSASRIARASASGFFGGTSQPVSPSRIKSGRPPTFVATTGTPHKSDSTAPAAIFRMRRHHRQIQVRVQRRDIPPRSQKRERAIANCMAAISQPIFIPRSAIPSATNHDASNVRPLVSRQIQRREEIFVPLQPAFLAQEPFRRVHIRHHAHQRNVRREPELAPQLSGPAGRELPDVRPGIRKENAIRRNPHFQIFAPRPLTSGNPTVRRSRESYVETRERRRFQMQRPRHLKDARYLRSAAQGQSNDEHSPHVMAMDQVWLNSRDKLPARRENSGKLPRPPRGEVKVDRDHFGAGSTIRWPEAAVGGRQRDHHVDAQARQDANLLVNPCRAHSRLDDVQYSHRTLATRSLPQKLRYGQSGEEVVIKSDQPLAICSRARVS